MLSLTYLSSASRLMSEAELASLLAASREANAAVGITGMLLYVGGNIIQVIEGPEDVVRETYARICADPRHKGLIQMFEMPITERQFPDWSMGYRRITEPGDQRDGYSTYLSETPSRGEGAVDPAHLMLRVFKDAMR